MWRKALWLIPVLMIVALLVGGLFRAGFTFPERFPVLDPKEVAADAGPSNEGVELATFGSGCFWCTEAVFKELDGVQKVASGYSGGHVVNPTYQQVCLGATGHAEVVQVTFDPAVISYPELLEVFWRSHDPTTIDRQGPDSGPQYRSVVFTHSEAQQRLAQRYKQKIDAAEVFSKPVVTEITPFTAFYPAEAYHEDYYAQNSRQPYCRTVIQPKIEKLRSVFRDKLKTK